MNAWDRLAPLLSPPELERLRLLLSEAPTSATAATFLPSRGLLWVGAQVEGVLAGWLLTSVDDEAEARVVGASLCAALAQAYGPLRAAREAAVDAIRKAAH